MSNLYFKKDVHKSIEGLLYGLYVYQYFLDTSTFGLLLRSSAPSQAIIYWLDTVILVLQVTEALLVFKVIKSEEIPRRSTSPPTTTTAAPARTSSPSSSSNTPVTSSNGEPGSGSTSALPALVDQSTVSGSSSSNNQPSEYIPRHVNNNNNSRHSEDLDEIYTEYYEDEEEVRFSTDLDRQQQLGQPSQGSLSSQRNRSSGAAARGASNSSSSTDESSEGSSEEDDEDPLGDDYEEVLEQETFVFQLRFQDLVAYIFSSQEALTMPDARTLTGATVANRVQSGSGSAQQRELPV
ncbi:hypothetical protein KI688_008720 [Linnemannia hyalina]|uniref:DUF1746 domain-containing protein n=1 Tax=Linnemannia hyalina TaxID=64524 RepID=A0A9P7Y1D2_9FUNG|nr:hypothetical protein KI688_008720 [Linnemannia hyalina]